MDKPEPFSFVKMVSSPLTGLFWVKCIMFGLGIACLIFIGYGVYGYFFKPKPPAQTQAVQIGEGSTVTIVQQVEKKKTLIPFIEVGVDQQSSRDLATYIRGGIRWEF